MRIMDTALLITPTIILILTITGGTAIIHGRIIRHSTSPTITIIFTIMGMITGTIITGVTVGIGTAGIPTADTGMANSTGPAIQVILQPGRPRTEVLRVPLLVETLPAVQW